MATIDKRPLKAFVRFDGTGRIVPSSLILRRKKPKVGKWIEIPAYECCEPTTTIPITNCFTYEVDVNGEETSQVSYTNCNGEPVEIEIIGPAAEIFCAQLGSVEATGIDVNVLLIEPCSLP